MHFLHIKLFEFLWSLFPVVPLSVKSAGVWRMLTRCNFVMPYRDIDMGIHLLSHCSKPLPELLAGHKHCDQRLICEKGQALIEELISEKGWRLYIVTPIAYTISLFSVKFIIWLTISRAMSPITVCYLVDYGIDNSMLNRHEIILINWGSFEKYLTSCNITCHWNWLDMIRFCKKRCNLLITTYLFYILSNL